MKTNTQRDTQTHLYNSGTGKFIYHEIVDHPTVGSQLLFADIANPDRGWGTGIPIYDYDNGDLVFSGEYLTIEELKQSFFFGFGGLKGGLFWDKCLQCVIALHYEFGVNCLNEYNKNPGNIDAICNQFIQKCITCIGPPNKELLLCMVYMLLVVSCADILACQPYGVNRLSSVSNPAQFNEYQDINKTSSTFHFISNMPKQYRGGNINIVSQVTTNGYGLANHILGMIEKL